MQGTLCQPLHVGGQKLATWEDVARLDVEGRLVFVVDNNVYCVDDQFLHPGGNEVGNAPIDSGCIA